MFDVIPVVEGRLAASATALRKAIRLNNQAIKEGRKYLAVHLAVDILRPDGWTTEFLHECQPGAYRAVVDGKFAMTLVVLEGGSVRVRT